MPIYDFKCPNCGRKVLDQFMHSWKDDFKCVQCHTVMSRLVSSGVVADTFPADGVYLEHVSAEGKTFKTKTEMKNYAKDNNLELGYLL